MPSSIAAGMQSGKFPSQHYYKTLDQEGTETVTTVTAGAIFIGHTTSVLVHIYLVISVESMGLE